MGLRTGNILRGAQVRLTGVGPDDASIIARWYEDTAFLRLWDAEPAYPRGETAIRDYISEHQKRHNAFIFAIRKLGDERPIGYVELDGILWNHGGGWLSIGIGEAAHRGQGYGREAIALLLDFAFAELNLHRVQLTVFEYNEGAIALYEKVGFMREGVYRSFMQRDGRRYDMYLYGLLRAEWEANRTNPAWQAGLLSLD